MQSSLRKFYCFIAPVFSSIMTYHQAWNKSTTTGVASGVVPTDSSGAHKCITGLSRVRVTKSLVFCVVLHRSLIVILPIFFWSLYYLSFDIRLFSAEKSNKLNKPLTYIGEVLPYVIHTLINTYINVYYILYYISTFVLLSLGRYLWWWTISPRWYHPSSSQCFMY